MSRYFASVVAVAVLAAASGAADPPAGTWKLNLRIQNENALLLLAFAQADGKWTGSVPDSALQFKADPKFESVTVAGNSLKFVVTLDKQPFLSFDGVVAKDGKKISGSLSLADGPLELIDLKPTAVKKVSDQFELMRETLAQSDDAQTVFNSSILVLGQAAAKKLKTEDVRAVVDRATKLAGDYGPRWERTAALKFASVLADQAGFEDVALAQARKAERLLADDDEATVRLEVLETLVRTLVKAKKPDDAKKYDTPIQRLEARDYQDYGKNFPPFKVDEFKGRKAKGDRVAVVELFTANEIPPIAAFEYAKDAVLKAYKPTDVIVLTYHVNLGNSFDVFANKGSQERLAYYQQSVKQLVLSFVDGRKAVQLKQETTVADSKAIFDALKDKIEDDLEKPAGCKLTLAVTPAEKGFTGKATIADLEKAGEQTFLRFALVEERVRYAAGNGVRYHHNVVRAMPGGKGVAVKQKAFEHSVTVNPDEVREGITKYLDDLTKDSEFGHSERPLALKNLKLVAFIQNDSTGEILTAAQTDLAKKE